MYLTHCIRRMRDLLNTQTWQRALNPQVSPIRVRSAGLLTAGMVFGYGVWLLWAAVGSEPDDYKCVAHRQGGQTEVIKVISFPDLLQEGSVMKAVWTGSNPLWL